LLIEHGALPPRDRHIDDWLTRKLSSIEDVAMRIEDTDTAVGSDSATTGSRCLNRSATC
jgi:hypothetical protein